MPSLSSVQARGIASPGRESQALLDSIKFNESEKKEMNVSIVPASSSLDSPEPEHLVPRNWPDQPERLAASRLYEIGMTAYDIFLCVLALALIMKTTLCIVSFKISGDGDPNHTSSTLTYALQIVNEQIVTAFTVIFITIMTTVTRRFALWKAQHGAYVSDLEQMYGSISVPSTIKMILVLRKFTLFSLLLTAIWSFYYLGSQASSREYVLTPSGPLHQARGIFPGDNVFPDFTKPELEWETFDNPLPDINEEFAVMGLLALDTGTDVRGFVRVPDMRYMKFEDEPKKWVSTTPVLDQVTNTQFSSYTGRQTFICLTDLDGKPSSAPYWDVMGTALGTGSWRVIGRYTFTTSFLAVECDTIQPLSADQMPFGVAETTKTSFNLSSADDPASTLSQAVNFDVWHKWSRGDLCLAYETCSGTESIEGMDHGVLRVGCKITRPHVEIQATCPAGACRAEKSRYLDTFASNPFINKAWSLKFFDSILQSTGPPAPRYGNDTSLQYRLRTDSLAKVLYTKEQIDSKVSTYGSDLTQAFNTYFNLADTYMGENPSYAENLSNYTSFMIKDSAMYEPQYRIIWPWIVLDYVATSILFAASIFSFWLRKRTLAPDIFGYVSSLTRDNPYVPVTNGGSSLSGLDRARAMQNVKIKIADVRQGDDIGKVGVVRIHGDINGEALSKDRKYL